MKSSTSQSSGKPSGHKQRSAGSLVVNTQNEVLLILSSRNQSWEFPKGKLDEGESDEEAALRETQEETGLTELALIPGFDQEIHFSFPVPEGKVINKTVRYFAFRTTQSDVQVDDKHSDYQWVDRKAALDILKHENYKRLVRELYKIL